MLVGAVVVMCNCYLIRILPNTESRRKKKKKISKSRNINNSFDHVIQYHWKFEHINQCHTIESITIESRKTDKCDYDIIDSESKLIESEIVIVMPLDGNVVVRQF